MGQKLVIGPYNKGLKNDVTAFNVDNDNFPQLFNAYQWRSRVKRKRGTLFLYRLTRTLITTATTDGTGAFTGNLLTGLETNATVAFNSIVIGSDVFTDPGFNGILIGSSGGTGTIDYVTGVLTIVGGPANTAITFSYYPALPVMGLEDLLLYEMAFPGQISFDTKYAYNVPTNNLTANYDVSFYKNPLLGFPGYIRKTTATHFTWNGQNYQQFWSTNYQNALWVTNGITVPFTTTNVGMQFNLISEMTITSATPTNGPSIVNLTIPGTPVVIGDLIFVNEVVYTAPNTANSINFQTGYVTAVAGDVVTVEFPDAYLTGTYASGGIAQYLTTQVNTTLDCIRWYDGDPTGSVAGSGLGWVNFTPPISFLNMSIGDLPARQYYLVTARVILQFKDRLLFFGVVVQASTGPTIYLQDTIVYSQNGTPYYTASFTGDPTLANTVFNPVLVPINQTATPNAYWGDLTGYGGFVTSGLDQPINAVSQMDDVLGVEFTTIQTKLVYGGNDIVPFLFYVINSEYGSSSTFSVINMDKSSLSFGTRGILGKNQTSCARIDLDIPEEVFNVDLLNNGNERVCAQRDFQNEWIHFTYSNYADDDIEYVFPTTTLQYNYRNGSWGKFFESYTTYGQLKKSSGIAWQNMLNPWGDYQDPWEDYELEGLEGIMIGGNQEGFVLQKNVDTFEGTSLFILGFNAGVFTVPDHCLNEGDYILISGAMGTISSQINGNIFSVFILTKDTFQLNPAINMGTYIGGGLITRMYIPFMQSKQFPVWDEGRKIRLGPQQYLMSTTANSQVTLYIYLSQDSDVQWNSNINPLVSPIGNTIFSTVLYTCVESTNLGLTPANVNLLTPLLNWQQQIWHRINTSLLGDTIQFAITMDDAQMRNQMVGGGAYSITAITIADPTVVTYTNPEATSQFAVGQSVFISGVIGMTQINNPINPIMVWVVIAETPTTVTLQVDSTIFTPYISGGTIQTISPVYQFSEIEMHGAILDISPSGLLA
jgi:hypothetical protein